MQVIARRTLRLFWERYPQAETPLRSWFAAVSQAKWTGPSDLKRQFGTSVDFVSDNRVIFDVGGNKFRLVAHVSYGFGRVLVKHWSVGALKNARAEHIATFSFSWPLLTISGLCMCIKRLNELTERRDVLKRRALATDGLSHPRDTAR